MDTPKPKLADFAHNQYSQFGEDGIIEAIFKHIGTQSKLCIEFGAWEGYFDSNTANLWSKGWRGVLIEGNTNRFNRLRENVKQHNCVCINRYVEPNGPNSLEALLVEQNVSDRPDLLSIDIDGNDYAIFENLTTLKPRVVIVEYNPSIPDHVDLVAVTNNHFGCSVHALTTLAKGKGYQLVATTDTNAFFVDEKELSALTDFNLDYASITTKKHITYLVTDYDGHFALIGQPPYQLVSPLKQAFRIGQVTPWPESAALWKRVAKKIRRAELTEKLLAIAHHHVWKWNGQKTPPPHLHKEAELRKLQQQYHLETFIETGTFLGDMVKAMAPFFKRIISVEVEPNLYRRALKRFVNEHHVELLFGDSGQVLKTLVPTLSAPALFWLDGHYSAGITGKGELDTPISAELDAILASEHPHVIVIDDARCFDGTNSYPTLEALQTRIKTQHPRYQIEIKTDMIFLTPVKPV